jgi:hypothetical protein
MLNLEREEREKDQPMLQTERSERKKENEKEVKKLNDLLKKKEKSEKMMSLALERSVASEKEVREEVEGLQRALTVTKEPTVFDLYQAYNAAYQEDKQRKCRRTLLALHEHIMSISDEQLKYQVRFSDEDGNTMLHIAALYSFPHAALSRLVRCGCDINSKNISGYPSIYNAKAAPATFDSLALLGADLSIRDAAGGNIWQLMMLTEIKPLYVSHGLREVEWIPAGFVSPLHGMGSAPMPKLHNESIMKLPRQTERCIRIMTLEMEKLRVEARVRWGR